MRVRRAVHGGLVRVFGPTVVKHYVEPRRVRGTQTAYDARRFFESWHAACPADNLSDADTLAPGRGAVATRFHYDAVECAILDCLAGELPEGPRVLDVGSGAGHWLDFYADVFGARRLVGVEISRPAAAALRARYAHTETVEVVEADVSSPAFDLDEEFEVVNAIGVMFHIVDDAAWRRAVSNLARRLVPGGFLVVGGQFGRVTQNVQFHARDEFASWKEFHEAEPAGEAVLVNKRIRSLRAWRGCAREAGLEVRALRRTVKSRRIRTPENNVLVLRRPATAPSGRTAARP
jgi:SAM-dependent methyltransferase